MTSLIRQIGVLTFSAPDPGAAAADLRHALGLRPKSGNADVVQVSSNSRRCEVAYIRGEEAGVVSVGLEAADAAAVDEALRRVQSEKLEVLRDKPRLDGVERSFTFRTPFGPVFEVHTPVPREEGPLYRYNPARLARLDHCTMRASDPQGFHDLVTKILGLRLSDRTENFSNAWYRAGDGYHHALSAGVGSGLHHYGFAARSIVDVADIADGLASEGRRLLWGLGRHGPGNNIFSYYRDPLGCIVEVSTSMERVDADELRPPGIWSEAQKQELMDLWGSKAPEGFAAKTTPFLLPGEGVP